MRRLVMWNLITLDRFFDGPKSWTSGWHEEVWSDEMERLAIEQSRSIGTLLFGRVVREWPPTGLRREARPPIS